MSEKEQQFERIYKETENFERTQFVREIQMQINDNKRKDKEIKRLNNIINELEKWLKEDLKEVYRDAGYRHNLILEVLDKLHELKGSDK